MTKVRYLDSLKGREVRLGFVQRDGIYETTEDYANYLIKSGKYEIVKEEKKKEEIKKEKNEKVTNKPLI